jgi:hypothetical protein
MKELYKSITFPNQSIGMVYAGDKSKSPNYYDWDFFEAKGNLKFPENFYVLVDINDEFTNQVLDFIGSLENGLVQAFIFFGKKFDNKLLKQLNPLKDLHRLSFILTNIDSIKNLEWDKFNNLEELIFSSSKFECNELNRLSNLRKLKKLYLNGIRVTESCLAVISNFKEISELGLRLCNISNENLSMLCKLPNLKTLDISGNPITDGGLNYLSEIKNLSKLYVENTLITEIGLQNLDNTLSNCVVRSKQR